MNDAMREAWERVAAELEARGRTPAWLAHRIGSARQRIYNWKDRGLPATAYPEVAKALGKTIDWVAGLETTGDLPTAVAGMSSMALKLAQDFDRIKDDAAQLAAFAHCIAVIARACDVPPEPPVARPGPKPSV